MAPQNNRRLTDEEVQLKMMEHTKYAVDAIVGLFNAPPKPRHLSEGQRLDQWKALRANFEQRTREILEGSDFAGGDVPFILSALSDNSPSEAAWEDFIAEKST